MADISVERKDRSIWPWILGLLLLGLLIWGLFELLGNDDEVAELPVATEPAPVIDEVQPLPPGANPPTPIAQAAGIPVSQIINSPATYTGQRLTGEVRVVEVPTDRGFWIEDQGERLFVVINEPAGESININPGQSIRMREAMVYENVTNVAGTVDPDTRRIAEGQPVLLGVDARNVEILSRPGT